MCEKRTFFKLKISDFIFAYLEFPGRAAQALHTSYARLRALLILFTFTERHAVKTYFFNTPTGCLTGRLFQYFQLMVVRYIGIENGWEKSKTGFLCGISVYCFGVTGKRGGCDKAMTYVVYHYAEAFKCPHA